MSYDITQEEQMKHDTNTKHNVDFMNDIPMVYPDDKILVNELVRYIKNKMTDCEADGLIINKNVMLEILSELEL